jgi:hypothetical protein
MQPKWWSSMGRCRKKWPSRRFSQIRFEAHKPLISLLYFWLLTKTQISKSGDFYFFWFFSTFGNSNPKKTPHFWVSDFVMWLKWQCSWLPTGTYYKNLVIWILFFSKIWRNWVICPIQNPLHRLKIHIFQVEIISTKKKTTAKSVLSWHVLNVLISH